MVTTLTVKRMYRLKRGKIHQQGDYNIAGPAPLSAFWNSTNSPCPLSNGVLTPAASPSRLSWSCCTSWSVGEITKVCNLSTDCVQTSDWMVSPWPFYKNRSQQKPPKHPLRHSFTFYVCVCFSLFVCFISLFAFSFDVIFAQSSFGRHTFCSVLFRLPTGRFYVRLGDSNFRKWKTPLWMY